ncbi:type 1 glutamine amidotransferase domain-containing protein [Bacillus testis]|uniref:type 1 glutamine amidotransferase domain-containing protein n=1 Tax=Bacillus testis TaxID=1622072 RepID=UPI00067ED9F4|nr:type 1 glutamine amidotransferase domain-containing protein [Bacillus testis]
MGKKIATVLTNYFEDVEYTQPAEAFKKEGHEVVTIEKEAGATVKGKQGEAEVKIDKGIDDVKAEDFDALFIPGGFSPDQLRGDERFVKFAKSFADANKPIFAICHGPQLLITAEVLNGKKATGYHSIAVDMKNAGVNFEDQEVVVDDQLVTSRQPDDIPAFNREALAVLAK